MEPHYADQMAISDVKMHENHKACKKKPAYEVIIDESMECESSDDELLITSVCEKNDESAVKINLEQTLPPGAAPTGFKVIDEVYSQESDEKLEEVEKKPLITISFKDNDVAGRYKNKFMTFLNDVVIQKNKNCTTQWRNLVIEVWGNLCNETAETCVDSKNDANLEESLFIVDTTPAMKNDLDVPTYGKKFDTVLEKDSVNRKAKVKEKVSKLTCFNCNGNHNLRECTSPRNPANIIKNRKEFAAKRLPQNRYHQEDDQRLCGMVPGQISKNLSKALGLKDNELPKFIYNMRHLGYPPGWLEEAKLQHSGLILFNSDGIAEGDPDDEDGEIVNLSNKDRYDIKKIIDFPGFNVHPPRGTFDECKQYWGSEHQRRNSKTAMLHQLSDKKMDEGYKKQKLKKCVPISTESIVEPSEMDVEILDDVVIESVNGLFIPPLPKEDTKPPEPPQLPEESDCPGSLSSQSTQEESTAPSSPSLSDLEYAKKHILEELEDSSSQSNLENTGKPNSPLNESGKDSRPDSGSKTLSKPNNVASNRGQIKSVELGTPIIKSESPYSKLPSSEKFSKDICDVINFENLPDTTGKYEKMSGLLQKVRGKLAEINKD